MIVKGDGYKTGLINSVTGDVVGSFDKYDDSTGLLKRHLIFQSKLDYKDSLVVIRIYDTEKEKMLTDDTGKKALYIYQAGFITDFEYDDIIYEDNYTIRMFVFTKGKKKAFMLADDKKRRSKEYDDFIKKIGKLSKEDMDSIFIGLYEESPKAQKTYPNLVKVNGEN